mgnify:CR=1 FL=1
MLRIIPEKLIFSTMSKNERSAYWKNEDGLPQATLVVTVTDPKWISHLKPSMEWETTAYEM